jgi:chemotaxis protein CheC
MSDAFELSADDSDSIAELFNIGMGPPAAALSELVGESVELSVPALQVVRRLSIADELAVDQDAAVIAVREEFHGPFAGEAMLMFSQAAGLSMVQRLIPGELPPEERDEIVRDTLGEIGNIILNGCVASFSNMIRHEVAGGVPQCSVGALSEVLSGRDEMVMFVHIEARLSSGDTDLQVLFFLDVAALDTFRLAIKNALAGLAG